MDGEKINRWSWTKGNNKSERRGEGTMIEAAGMGVDAQAGVAWWWHREMGHLGSRSRPD